MSPPTKTPAPPSPARMLSVNFPLSLAETPDTQHTHFTPKALDLVRPLSRSRSLDELKPSISHLIIIILMRSTLTHLRPPQSMTPSITTHLPQPQTIGHNLLSTFFLSVGSGGPRFSCFFSQWGGGIPADPVIQYYTKINAHIHTCTIAHTHSTNTNHIAVAAASYFKEALFIVA